MVIITHYYSDRVLARRASESADWGPGRKLVSAASFLPPGRPAEYSVASRGGSTGSTCQRSSDYIDFIRRISNGGLYNNITA